MIEAPEPTRADDETALRALELIGAGLPFDAIDRRLGLKRGSAVLLYLDISEALGEDQTAH